MPPISAEVDTDLVQRECRTDGFDVDGVLVIRRDVTFTILLTTRGKIQRGKTSATLVYEEGKDEVALQVVQEYSRLHGGGAIKVAVPVNTPITLYLLKVKGLFEDGTPFEVDLSDRVVVLFNAWSPNDTVYLEDEALRQEYVLNSRGRLYIGNHRGEAWNLALYQEDTLRAVLLISETASKLTFDQKRDPVLFSRELTEVLNSDVLVGNWSDDYSGGEFPWFWTGSGAILKRYYQSGGKPVKYGQCWVFSGVLLSVLRVLGIPSRSITNFSSAHDSNRNRTIDEYYDADGERLDYLSTGGDSIWNFHVWNETWMRRPDLPAGFDGWQAVDSTPQEESPQGGGYRTGPSPLKAIKDGNSVLYDANFLIAEVNADIKKYVVEENSAPRLFQVDTRTVGKGISTKAVGTMRREDVTDQYKYPEGTDWERRSLYNGYKELLEMVNDMEFSIPEMDFELGEDVKLVITATNKAKEAHNIRGKIRCEAVTYTGKALRLIETYVLQDGDERVGAGKSRDITMSVDGGIFSEYARTKVFLKFIVTLGVNGTAQMFSETVMVGPRPQELSITGPDQLLLGQTGKLLIAYKNSLPVPMKDVTLTIDCDQLGGNDILHNLGTIEPKAEVKYVLDMTGTKLGGYMITAGLSSDKVEHVTGELEITVTKEEVPVEPLDVLEIESVDLNKTANQTSHFTADYDYDGLVVRRGQGFTISITTNKTVPKGSKVVTRAIFQLQSKDAGNVVSYEVIGVSSTKGKTFKLELTPPADVSVGEYELLLSVNIGGVVSVLHRDIKCVILFNPWCAEDSCYYDAGVSDLDEYVLNTKGRIWVGSARSNYGRPWQFAQFSKDCLEVALWILEHMNGDQRNDPVEVSRTVAALTNVQDDDGILEGNWSGDYSGGTSPLEWTGSGPILKEFNVAKEPVQFGQCWVFSGLQTSLLRCLGMPARSITNFNSAHDTDFNRAIDKFFDEEGDPLSNDDSIWNFHVWNEAWMSRPLLPKGFGGWQALDATPQEESPQGGGYRCGPASVQAIKLGQRMDYDVEFVISEVNADIRYYTVDDAGNKTLTRVNPTHVGKSISTKAVGGNSRDDVTLNYKFREGSNSERAALNAETESEAAIGMDLEVDETVAVGEDFTVRATITNKSTSARTLRVRLYGRAALYTGAPGQMIREINFHDKFAAKERKQYTLNVEDWDYIRILKGGTYINFVCMAIDKNANKSVLKTEDLRLQTPDIALTIPRGGLKLYHPVEIGVEFVNPLRRSLTGGKFVLSGDGFVQDTTVNVPVVRPLNTVQAVLKTIPVKKGTFELVVRFSSNQLTDVMGDEDVTVKA